LEFDVITSSTRERNKKNHQTAPKIFGDGGGGCIIVDASVRKEMPDSFSRTIPLWCACINRIAGIYKREQQQQQHPQQQQQVNETNNSVHDINDNTNTWKWWDDQDESFRLFTPEWIVSHEEHATMEQLIHVRVQELYASHAIPNPKWLAETLDKPLRPYWITPQHAVLPNSRIGDGHSSSYSTMTNCLYYPVICWNASEQYPLDDPHDRMSRNSNNPPVTNDPGATAPPPPTNLTKKRPTPMWRRTYNGQHSFWYTAGAADDHEMWARHLNPRLFWQHCDKLLFLQDDSKCSKYGDSVDDDYHEDDDHKDTATDQAIDALVIQESQRNDTFEQYHHQCEVNAQNTFDFLGVTKIAVGTRRAGRPPECWQHFDAILNVTDMEYPNMTMMMMDESSCVAASGGCDCTDGNNNNNSSSLNAPTNENHSSSSSSRYYLQLPVQEGKRDRSELERWMAVGIAFVYVHAVQHNRSVLIHCAQGKDRSVAVAMATIALFGELKFPLQWKTSWQHATLLERLTTSIFEVGSDEDDSSRHGDHLGGMHVSGGDDDCDEGLHQSSGLSQRLVQRLMGREGRDRLLEWVHKEKRNCSAVIDHENAIEIITDNTNAIPPPPLATKATMRIVLHLLRQDREKADPTRSTMQKLNRFFMSGTYDLATASGT
jgi:tRNA A64-2'-O-ribosylphosphate transferase